MNEQEIELTDEDIIEEFIIPKQTYLPDEFAFMLVNKPSKLEKQMRCAERAREIIREAIGF
jgi:hypothetical protein